MQADLSNVEFNVNHKRDSAAREVAIGLRLIAFVFAVNLVLSLLSLFALDSIQEMHGVSAGAWIVSLILFGCFAYGLYRAMDGLGWSGMMTLAIIAMFLIPYFNILLLVFVLVKGIAAIKAAGFRFSLFGPLKPLAK